LSASKFISRIQREEELRRAEKKTKESQNEFNSIQILNSKEEAHKKTNLNTSIRTNSSERKTKHGPYHFNKRKLTVYEFRRRSDLPQLNLFAIIEHVYKKIAHPKHRP
jgi:hypothetical protein